MQHQGHTQFRTNGKDYLDCVEGREERNCWNCLFCIDQLTALRWLLYHSCLHAASELPEMLGMMDISTQCILKKPSIKLLIVSALIRT